MSRRKPPIKKLEKPNLEDSVERPGFRGSASFNYEYCNHTGYTLVVKTRDNIGLVIESTEPERAEDRGFLKVVKTYWARNKDVKLDIVSPFNEAQNEQGSSDYDDTLRQKLDIYSRTAVGRSQVSPTGETYARVTAKVGINELRVNSGCVYIASDDLLVYVTTGNKTTHDAAGEYHHPFSDAGGNEEFMRAVEDRLAAKKVDFRDMTLYSYRIVDNANSVAVKYININNQIFAVKPVRDLELTPGVYFYGSLTADKEDQGFTEVIRRELDFLTKENGFYNTVDEAMTFGRPELIAEERERIRKEEIAKLEHQVKITKLEKDEQLIRLKAECEELDRNYKKEVDRTKTLEEASERQKREYLNTVKFMTAVFTTVAGLLAILAKFGGSKS